MKLTKTLKQEKVKLARRSVRKFKPYIPWKNYSLGFACLLVGVWAFSRGNNDGGIKAAMAGFAIITLLDAFGKVLVAIDANRQSLDGLRAAIETELSRKAGT